MLDFVSRPQWLLHTLPRQEHGDWIVTGHIAKLTWPEASSVTELTLVELLDRPAAD